jgi:hypothetical protein
MRAFTYGTGTDRKVVSIEVHGSRVVVAEVQPDGSTRRNEKEYGTEALGRAAGEQMARALLERGYHERTATGPRRLKPPTQVVQPSNAATTSRTTQAASGAAEPAAAIEASGMFDDEDLAPAADVPVLTRMAFTPGEGPASEDASPKKKKSGGKKKKRKRQKGREDGLDKRVLAGAMLVGLAFVGLLGFLGYEAFLKPPSIVGTWAGSRLEYEAGGPMSFTKYRLVLDEQHRASMAVQDGDPMEGTYSVKGDRLTLKFKGEDGDTDTLKYKISLGHATLDLFEPKKGKKMVELVRMRDKPMISGPATPAAAPKDLAAAGTEKADKATDDRLASVRFSPKDNAFALRAPADWTTETGSRPDNAYSWARFTQGSAKIQVYADLAGSLMSGSDSAQPYEKGSSMAPVHRAHDLYKRTVEKEYTDYKESEPTLFEGSALGEGRIAAFTASEGGLFGSKLRGIRVTLLTNDRRVTLLCQSPPGEFAKYKPTFMAVCRSVGR